MVFDGNEDSERYDDLIIGAGSAGAVIASRLSEDPNRRVLLLEAGPDHPDFSSLPHALRSANEPVLSGHNWPIRALLREERGPNATDAKLGSVNPAATFDYAVGKVVGGSSAVNGALALRGLQEDYDEWAADCGPSWSWAEVFPRFLAMETDREGDVSCHGRSGPVPIRRDTQAELAPLQAGFVEACLAHGFAKTSDHNDPTSTGVGVAPRNVAEKVRMSTSLTHLGAARTRANLTIVSGAHVNKIVWKAANRCDGVETEVGGKSRRFLADRIICCAGTLNTPSILMRSGIGDPAALASLGVETKISLSGVGANLIDHPVVIMWAVPKPGASTLGEPTHQALLRYTSSRSASRNDLHLYMLSGIDTGMFPLLKPALKSSVGIGISVGFMKPKSRGHVRLTSLDPQARPQVIANCLAEKDDTLPLKEGVRVAWQLLQNPCLRRETERIHMWSEGMIKSDVASHHAIVGATRPSWHAVGTAKMGSSPERGAVVDPSGRVFGTENLWVADASIMPTIPSAPTNLTCIMIGEKIAAELRRKN